MIFSKKNDFLFIKGRKVAGTSIELALSTICGPDDVIPPITPIDEIDRMKRGGTGAQNYSPSREEEEKYLERLRSKGLDGESHVRAPHPLLYWSHMSLMEFVEQYGSLPTQRVFCVERSPYAKIISKTVMNAKFAKYRRTGKNMSIGPKRIKNIIEAQMERGDFDSCKNIDLYRGSDGRITMRVLRQEALDEQFPALMNDLGISPAPELPHVKQGMNSNGMDPRTVFTREQLDKINEAYAEEFDTFGYERL